VVPFGLPSQGRQIHSPQPFFFRELGSTRSLMWKPAPGKCTGCVAEQTRGHGRGRALQLIRRGDDLPEVEFEVVLRAIGQR
jgi:hypothetical protein